ncbi:MAG TPA: hypothetical protein VFJ19_10830 [Nocardioidaceae bacterium]|nr:hypothetical protein [Nocardioidaceae bacterium]
MKMRLPGCPPATPIGAAVVLAALALMTSACGNSGAPSAGGAQSASDGGTTVVSTTKTSLGSVLVGKDGMTLYMYEHDAPHRSNCTGECLATWPAVGKASAGSGVKGSLLGTIKRGNGSVQATYNGHPLYYFTGDSKKGDVTGQDLESFHVASAQGGAVHGGDGSSGSPTPYSKSNGGGGY